MRLLADMEVFVEVAKAQNFGRAAVSLGMTASTLSRRITRLEKELGLILIHRSTRSFALTELGQTFFERAQGLIGDALRTRDELGGAFAKVCGHLRVGSPSDLVTTVLAPVFAKYCRDNAGISVDIVSTQRQPDLNRDSLDVAFSVAHQIMIPDSSHCARQIGSFPRMLYASKVYLKRNGAPSLPQELQRHACIRYFDGTAEGRWDLRCENKRQTVVISGVCASNSAIMAAQAARGHLGIAMLPQHLATHPTFGAGLVRVLPEWQGTPAMVFAVTAERTVPAKIEELVRIAKAEFTRQIERLEAVIGSSSRRQSKER